MIPINDYFMNFFLNFFVIDCVIDFFFNIYKNEKQKKVSFFLYYFSREQFGTHIIEKK